MECQELPAGNVPDWTQNGFNFVVDVSPYSTVLTMCVAGFNIQ